MTDSTAKMVDKDGFQLVQHRKRGKSKEIQIQQPPGAQKSKSPASSCSSFGSPSSSSDDSLGGWSNYSDEDPLEIDELFGKLEHAVEKVKSSAFLAGILEVFSNAINELQVGYNDERKVKKIVCFALGTLVRSASRYQFGLLRCIQQHFGFAEVLLYDPAFTKLDKAVMTTKFGFELLLKNREGKYEVPPASVNSDLTFFYLPHAEHELMNNLLYSNWTAEQLENCVIVGNSYGFWGEMNGHSTEVNQGFRGCEQPSHPYYYLHLAGELCKEHDIANNFEYDLVFMQSALHIFPKDKLKRWKEDDKRWKRYKPPKKAVLALDDSP